MPANCKLSHTENITSKAARAARWYGWRRAISMVLLSVLVLISGATEAQAASGTQPTAPPGKVSKLGDKFEVKGFVVSDLFHLHFKLALNTRGPKNYIFNGYVYGSPPVPVSSAIIGTVSTGDLDTLVRDTASFEFQNVRGVLQMHFISADHRLLGSLAADNVDLPTSMGNGGGSWR